MQLQHGILSSELRWRSCHGLIKQAQRQVPYLLLAECQQHPSITPGVQRRICPSAAGIVLDVNSTTDGMQRSIAWYLKGTFSCQQCIRDCRRSISR